MSERDGKSSPRGEATRARIVAAALALFGKRGFDGVGAREIAAAAQVPLAAIPYHFGTKERLYRAVLIDMRARLAGALAPALAEALEAPPQDARAALAALQAAFLGVLLSDEAEGWARLLLREHLDPSPAFDLVYDDSGRDIVDLFAALIARADGRDTTAPEVLIEAFAKVGEVLVFRVTRTAFMRRMGWDKLDAERLALMTSVLGDL